jgi:hypothetical protein
MGNVRTVELRAAFVDELDRIACDLAGVLVQFPGGERLSVESYFARRCLYDLDGIDKECRARVDESTENGGRPAPAKNALPALS